MNSADLRRYLTDDGVGDLVTLLLASRTTEEVAQLARRHGWEPIIEAARAAKNAFRRDYTYEVALSRHTDTRYYKVRTELRLRRLLRKSECHYVRFGRTANAVRQRLADDAMLGVELVPVTRAEWGSDDLRGSLAAEVAVDKRASIAAEPGDSISADALHLPVLLSSVLDEDEAEHHVQVVAQYLVPRDATYFPVKLANVYCQGETTISFRINDSEIEELDAWASLPGDVGLDPAQDGGVINIHPTSSAESHSIKVETSDQVLLWPGTTVVFVWRRPEAAGVKEALT